MTWLARSSQPMLSFGIRPLTLVGSLLLLFSTAYGAQAPIVSLSPTSLTFPSAYVNKTTAAQKVTLTNTGTATLNIMSIAVGGDFAQTNTCGSSVGSGGSCIISVTSTPTAVGTRTGAITITDNASNSPQSVGLTGNGIVAVANLSPTSLTFPGQNVDTTSVPQTVKLSNPGHSKLLISSIVSSGDFSSTNNCGGSVAPGGGSCTISVTFSPQASGTRTGSITLTDNALDSPQTLSLTGTGNSANVVLSPKSLIFGNQQVGTTSSAQTVTLMNAGASALNVTGVGSTGDFAQTNGCIGSLAAGASCTISATFTPMGGGTRKGTITITDSDPSSPQTVSLTGSGIGVSLSPASLTFGTQNVGTNSPPQTITLSNGGASQLDIISIIASGDFSQTNTCGSFVAGGGSCTISVRFNPSAAGSRTGYVTLSDSDPPAQHTANLSGSGQIPSSTVSVSPRVASVTFTQSQQFTAKISGVPSTSVTWSVDGIPSGNSSVGTISPSGLYTPPSAAGSHQITATSTANNTQSASVSAIVTNYEGTFTQHNDNARTGQNLNETVLNTGNVNQNQFGKLFSYSVDGYVYAQPLYVANLQIPGQGFHNVAYVATQHDSVYAFDADGLSATPLWQVSFINPPIGITSVPAGDAQNGHTTGDITPEIGITGTPVIDPIRGVLYVVAATKEVSGNVTSYVQRLHALDITTGAEMAQSPVAIQASVLGTGTGTDGQGHVPFNSLTQNQRPGLLLLNGVVYIAWGSHEDFNPYHGWVIGYDASMLQQVAAYNNSANNQGDGIWMSGAGLAADASNNIYFTTGTNQGTNAGSVDYNDSFQKLSTTGGLTVLDFFAPYNRAALSTLNADIGSGGPVLLPDQPSSPPHLLVGGGKDGTIFLLDRDNLGGWNPSDNNQVVQSLPNILGQIRGVPAFWQNNVYFVAVSDVAKAFRLYHGRLSTAPISASSEKVYGYPGATPVISANGSTNGVLWTLRVGQYIQKPPGPAILQAYDAADVSRILYTSSQAGTRDRAGPAVKMTVPTVANGKVYVGTQNQLNVYGLLP